MSSSLRRPPLRHLALVLTATAVLAACTADPVEEEPPGGPGPVVVTEGPAPPPGPTGPPTVGVTSLPPVPVEAPADFGTGLVAIVTGVEPLELTASGPGEVAGPGVSVIVDFRNDTGAPVDLGGVSVTAAVAGVPAAVSTAPPAAPVTGELAAGASTTGTWTFQAAGLDVDRLTVEISWTGSPNVVVVQR